MTNKLKTLLQKARTPVLLCIASGAAIGAAISGPPEVERTSIKMNPGPFAVVEQGANVALALSVEFPTVGVAYREDVFNPDKNYIGYWDYTGCYKYKDPETNASLNGEYFYRTGTWNANRECNHSNTSGEFSGNLLNYAASSSIDILRLGLTGGHREIDTPNQTVLARAYLKNDWGLSNSNNAPVRKIPIASFGKHLPAKPADVAVSSYAYISVCNDKMWLGSTAAGSAPCEVGNSDTAKTRRNLSILNTDSATSANKPYLPFYARVKVCDDSEVGTRIDLCQRFPAGNYKPVGEIQKNSDSARIGAFGYLNDNDIKRYGGVLRAPIEYIGPTVMDNYGIEQQNANREWDPATGVFIKNPRNAANGFEYSGAINYLNRFGTLLPGAPGTYKSWDQLGELYYEALRYFMGKQPSPAAISGVSSNITDIKADGFPFYSSWTDPILSTCSKKNFILTIGDVNSWENRAPSGPSINLANEGAFNPLSLRDRMIAAEGLTGVSADEYSKWQWAGAAYGANTQAIRTDSINGVSLDKIRVRTFAIDVDEGGNGSIENDNPRYRKPRRGSFYLGGKYGWFTDANGNKLAESGEWDSKQTNVPDGYVIASQADKMLKGIKDFFGALPKESASIYSTAMSSQSYSSVTPEGFVYIPILNPSKWSGSIEKRKVIYNLASGSFSLAATPTWDAATILTSGKFTDGSAAVAWNARKVFTYSLEPSKVGGQAFSVANKSNLDSAVVAALNTNPADNTADAQADARINFILGDRSNEKKTDGTGIFRPRSSLMGDVVSSGPVYKKEPDSLVDSGYATFMARTDVKARRPVVYTGANDGMLHAFDADNGKELFAYIPRAVAENLNRLTNPLYSHTQFVDGVPTVGEAKIYNSSSSTATDATWKTVLVSGMGGGAQGVFALDVTVPESFSASNVMFEFTDRDDPDMGNIVGKPKIVKMQRTVVTAGVTTYVTRWYVAVGSGYNNYAADGHSSTTGVQSLFLLSLDKKPGEAWKQGRYDDLVQEADDPLHNYYKISVQPPAAPIATDKPAVGMANPGVAKDIYGNAIAFYAGDLAGNLWKFDFGPNNKGLNSVNTSTAVKIVSSKKVPLAIFKDTSGQAQPITSAPLVSAGLTKGYMVIAGTGKFMESTDTTTTGTQSTYGIWDDGTTSSANYSVARAKLYARTFNADGTITGSNSFPFGSSAGQYRGWVVDLPDAKERVVVDGVLGPNYAAFTSVIPGGDECSGGGSGASMTFCPLYGSGNCGAKRIVLKDGFPGTPTIVYMDDSTSSYTYGTRSSTGRRSLTVKTQPLTTTRGKNLHEGGVSELQVPAGRVGWREIRQFLD